MQSPEVERYRRKLSKLVTGRTIVKVDRLDPIKNVVLGLDAFDKLLHKHPTLIGNIKLFAFLVPSRISIHEYREYAARVRRRIGEINRRYGRSDWHPIESFEENNYDQALAGMSLCDVLLVNSVPTA
jgi:trehalose-6-phosphate synthase